jgi:hypothetical protein
MLMTKKRSTYMVQKTTSPQMGPDSQASAADASRPEVADLLGKVEQLLANGQPSTALQRIGSSKVSSPWLANAAGVCQLRLGNAKAAVDTFRRLVLAAGGLILREDVPVVFKVNFAAALLADGNLAGGLRVLDEVGDKGHPAVGVIRDAVQRWKGGMTFCQKLWWSVGGHPPRPLVLDFALGSL